MSEQRRREATGSHKGLRVATQVDNAGFAWSDDASYPFVLHGHHKVCVVSQRKSVCRRCSHKLVKIAEVARVSGYRACMEAELSDVCSRGPDAS